MEAVFLLGSPRAAGSTAAVIGAMRRGLEAKGISTRAHLLGDMNIGYCRGCKACERTGACVQADDVEGIVREMLAARLVVVASPSYWGDVTGQLKVFIDRCTPFGDTNPARVGVETRAKGVAVAVRAGGSQGENLKLVGTIGHFLGHLGVPLAEHFTVEGIGDVTDLQARPEVLAAAHALGARLGEMLG